MHPLKTYTISIVTDGKQEELKNDYSRDAKTYTDSVSSHYTNQLINQNGNNHQVNELLRLLTQTQNGIFNVNKCHSIQYHKSNDMHHFESHIIASTFKS